MPRTGPSPATPQPTHATTDPPAGRLGGGGGGGSNNNEVYAHELVTVFDAYPPLNNPWTRGFFDKNVAPNIGVVSRLCPGPSRLRPVLARPGSDPALTLPARPGPSRPPSTPHRKQNSGPSQNSSEVF